MRPTPRSTWWSDSRVHPRGLNDVSAPHTFRESKLLTRVLPAAIKAGLGRVTWHQFRHIHSSLLNDLRVPVKIAQEQLGHASVSTTLSIYTHVVDASHRSAVEALEERLFVDLDSNGLESTKPPGPSVPVSNSLD